MVCRAMCTYRRIIMSDKEEAKENQTREKVIDVYHDAEKILKPAIKKITENIQKSGLNFDDLYKVDKEFRAKGTDENRLIRTIVSGVGDLIDD